MVRLAYGGLQSFDPSYQLLDLCRVICFTKTTEALIPIANKNVTEKNSTCIHYETTLQHGIHTTLK